MKPLKYYTIIGIIFVLITGTLAHFVYDWSCQNILVGFFFPVNESTWEHMKLIFFPMLFYTFCINKKMKSANPCVTSSFLLGILIGTILIPVIFYAYSGILGYNLLALDLLTFAVSVLTGFWVAYRAAAACNFAAYESTLKIAIFLMAIAFFYFTYFPPDIAIFENPIHSVPSFWYHSKSLAGTTI